MRKLTCCLFLLQKSRVGRFKRRSSSFIGDFGMSDLAEQSDWLVDLLSASLLPPLLPSFPLSSLSAARLDLNKTLDDQYNFEIKPYLLHLRYPSPSSSFSLPLSLPALAISLSLLSFLSSLSFLSFLSSLSSLSSLSLFFLYTFRLPSIYPFTPIPSPIIVLFLAPHSLTLVSSSPPLPSQEVPGGGGHRCIRGGGLWSGVARL